MTDVVHGKEGADNQYSFQGAFPEKTECKHCKEPGAVLTITVSEDQPGPFACNMYPNDPQGEGYWYHDAAAWALYTCRKCFEVTVLWNQA